MQVSENRVPTSFVELTLQGSRFSAYLNSSLLLALVMECCLWHSLCKVVLAIIFSEAVLVEC